MAGNGAPPRAVSITYSTTIMNAPARETRYDPVIRKFMRSFDGYLIARVISREYEMSPRAATGDAATTATAPRSLSGRMGAGMSDIQRN
jgi:hypothetical protein